MQPSSEIYVCSYVGFAWNLRNVIDPLTMKAGAKLSLPSLKIEVSGFG